MKSFRPLCGSLLLALASICQTAELPDSVLGTLQLDAELPARGRLGGVTVDRLGFIYVSN